MIRRRHATHPSAKKNLCSTLPIGIQNEEEGLANQVAHGFTTQHFLKVTGSYYQLCKHCRANHQATSYTMFSFVLSPRRWRRDGVGARGGRHHRSLGRFRRSTSRWRDGRGAGRTDDPGGGGSPAQRIRTVDDDGHRRWLRLTGIMGSRGRGQLIAAPTVRGVQWDGKSDRYRR